MSSPYLNRQQRQIGEVLTYLHEQRTLLIRQGLGSSTRFEIINNMIIAAEDYLERVESEEDA